MSKGKEQGSSEVFFCLGPAFLMASFMPVLLSFKDKVLNTFLPRFGAGLKVTSWSTDFSFVTGDQAVFMGSMSAIANESGVDTGKFSWAVRVHVEDGKVKSWNWFEDSFAVSNAYHAKQ